jgi:hypothetical protein
MPIWGEFFKRIQANEKLTYNTIDKFEKPLSMGDMDECDTEDQISLQRAEAVMNVSRGLEDDDVSEKNPFDNSDKGTSERDYE